MYCIFYSLVSEARLLNMEELRYSVAATSYCASPFDSTESPKNTKYRRLCMWPWTVKTLYQSQPIGQS